MLQTPNLP